MIVEDWPLDRLKPFEKNNRRHTQESTKRLAGLIERYGFRQPCAVQPNGCIVIGEGRWRAARLLGLPSIPVHVVELSEEDARALRIADNAAHDFSIYDTVQLSSEILELGELGFELEDLGFSPQELDLVLHPIQEPEPEAEKSASSGNRLVFDEDAWEVIQRACHYIREEEQQPDISSSRAIELVVADWLASK